MDLGEIGARPVERGGMEKSFRETVLAELEEVQRGRR